MRSFFSIASIVLCVLLVVACVVYPLALVVAPRSWVDAVHDFVGSSVRKVWGFGKGRFSNSWLGAKIQASKQSKKQD